MLLTRVLKKLFGLAMALDRADLPLLRLIPARAKSGLVRTFFNLFNPLMPEKPVRLNGLHFYVPRHISRSYLLQPHEPEVTAVLERCLEPGLVVVDVGANIGYHALHAARLVGPVGRVYAVEPGQDNLAYLEKNIALNRAENVQVLPYAAGASRRMREFHLLKLSLQNSFDLYEQQPDDIVGIQQVQEMPLDELIAEPVDFVKIDIEGAEIEALQGMQRILANPNIRLVVEWNPRALRRAGHAVEALPEFLWQRGFRLSAIDEKAQAWDNIGAIIRRWQSDEAVTAWYNLYAER